MEQQQHNRRHGSRLGAGRRGWDAAEQRSRGRLAAVAGPVGARGGRRGWKHRRQSRCPAHPTPRPCRQAAEPVGVARAGGNTGDSGVTTPLEPVSPPVGGSSCIARRAVRRAAGDMSTATTTAACTRARAARALYTLQQGPRSTKRAPSTAIEFQRARLRVGKTAFTSTTMWRMFAARTGGPRALARSRRRARAAATSRVTGPVWLPRAPPKCFVVRSGHGVACRSVSVLQHACLVYCTGG